MDLHKDRRRKTNVNQNRSLLLVNNYLLKRWRSWVLETSVACEIYKMSKNRPSTLLEMVRACHSVEELWASAAVQGDSFTLNNLRYQNKFLFINETKRFVMLWGTKTKLKTLSVGHLSRPKNDNQNQSACHTCTVEQVDVRPLYKFFHV